MDQTTSTSDLVQLPQKKARKLFIEGPSKKTADELLVMSRTELRLLTVNFSVKNHFHNETV